MKHKDEAENLMISPKLSFTDVLFGKKELGAPSIAQCIFDILTLQFMKDGEVKVTDDIRSKQLGLETSMGLLSALVLSPATSLFYSQSNSTIAVSLGFLSANFLVISMVSSVLHMLILQQLTSNEEVCCYVHTLGRNGACLTGQIMVFGIVLWIVGSVFYLYSAFESDMNGVIPFYVSISILFGLAGPLTYFICMSIASFYMTRHDLHSRTTKHGHPFPSTDVLHITPHKIDE